MIGSTLVYNISLTLYDRLDSRVHICLLHTYSLLFLLCFFEYGVSYHIRQTGLLYEQKNTALSIITVLYLIFYFSFMSIPFRFRINKQLRQMLDVGSNILILLQTALRHVSKQKKKLEASLSNCFAASYLIWICYLIYL